MKIHRLLPVVPAKDLRITFKPMELVALYVVLERSTTFFDNEALTKPNLKSMADALWELEAKVSDKLNFRPDVVASAPQKE